MMVSLKPKQNQFGLIDLLKGRGYSFPSAAATALIQKGRTVALCWRGNDGAVHRAYLAVLDNCPVIQVDNAWLDTTLEEVAGMNCWKSPKRKNAPDRCWHIRQGRWKESVLLYTDLVYHGDEKKARGRRSG